MAGGASQNELIGKITPMLEAAEGVDHRIHVDHNNPAGADQTF